MTYLLPNFIVPHPDYGDLHHIDDRGAYRDEGGVAAYSVCL